MVGHDHPLHSGARGRAHDAAEPHRAQRSSRRRKMWSDEGAAPRKAARAQAGPPRRARPAGRRFLRAARARLPALAGSEVVGEGEDKDRPEFLIFPRPAGPLQARLPRGKIRIGPDSLSSLAALPRCGGCGGSRGRECRSPCPPSRRSSIRRLHAQPDGRGWSCPANRKESAAEADDPSTGESD